MGAKDMSELGSTVTGVLDAEDRRGLVGLQGKLTQAQTDQIQAKIESMPKEAILAQMKLINDAVESGVIQDMEAAQAQYNALAAKLAELEGQKAPTGSDILSRRKIA
jgi:chromosome segregation ATPase